MREPRGFERSTGGVEVESWYSVFGSSIELCGVDVGCRVLGENVWDETHVFESEVRQASGCRCTVDLSASTF